MLRRFVLALVSPVFMIACGSGAAGYVALQPDPEATPHQRHLRDWDPSRSIEENRARTHPHRVACPTCRVDDALTTLSRTHHDAEWFRIMRGLHGRSERPFDHVRRCPACRARSIS